MKLSSVCCLYLAGLLHLVRGIQLPSSQLNSPRELVEYNDVLYFYPGTTIDFAAIYAENFGTAEVIDFNLEKIALVSDLCKFIMASYRTTAISPRFRHSSIEALDSIPSGRYRSELYLQQFSLSFLSVVCLLLVSLFGRRQAVARAYCSD